MPGLLFALEGSINPLFPALRSGPTAGSGAYPKSKFLAATPESPTGRTRIRVR